MMDKIVINNMLVTENQDAEVHEVMQEATLENLEVTPVAIVEESQDVVAQEVVQNVEVEDIETFVVEVNETFITMDAPNDALNHALLNNRELPNQHPIIAIEGLREKLDQIESLQTVYSDKKQQADYYMWRQDTEHPLPANPYGLFVSILKDTDKIQICDGTSDVFGVTVAEAAFIGNQEYVQADGGTKTGRDGNYCLVVNSGLAAVRRMPSVVVGDYVTPNSRGEAQKSDGNCGYLVTAVSDDNGLYAIISLNTPSTLTKNIADDVRDLSGRMSTAEYNITSVTNVANSAYALALDAKENAEVNSEYIEEKIEEVFGRMDAVDGVVGNLSESVNNASANAALAKTIAEGAVNSANAMKDEAVTKANEALTEASNTRKDLEENVEQINTNLNNTNLELQATKEGFASDIDSLRLDVEGEVADFRKEVEDNYATTTQLAAVKTETSDVLAALKTEVSDTYATIESVASLKTDTSDALAGFKQEVSETYATQEMLTSLETETSKSLTDYKQEVTDTYATQEMVTKLETDTAKALTDYKQEVTDTYATQELVSNLETETGKALTDYKQEVKDNYATQEMLTNLETDTTKALADYKQEVTDTYATQEMLTSFEGETNKSMASLKQQADDNGAKIEALVANVDKYAVGEYSQAYGLTYEQAISILTVGSIYVPTIAHNESYGDYTQEFSLGYYYEWKVDPNDTSDEPKPKWNASQSTAVNFDSKHVGGSTSSPYWVVETADVEVEVVYVFNSATASITKTYYNTTDNRVYTYNTTSKQWVYTSQTTDIKTGQTKIIYDLGGLYHWEENDWVKVASAADNVLSRAVSAIKVTANSIETSVTAIDNKYAGTKTWVDSNQAAIQDTVTWHSNNGDSLVTFMQEAEDNFASATQVAQIVDKDGNIKAASIVTAVNEDTSDVTIKADKIKFEGSQFQSMMSQTYSTKDEVVTAKQEAIKAAGDSVDEKLKDYSTTTQMQSVIDQKADSITLSVSQTYSTKDEMGDIEERVTDAEASIQINKDNIALKADKVDLDGYVTFTNLATESQTTIHGGNIETDTLSAITANLGTVNSGNIQSPGYMELVVWERNNETPADNTANKSSEDLAFEIADDKSYYIVKGIGTCTDTNIVIPTVYNDKPVKEIKVSAFSDNTNIKTVVIPDSITHIRWGAFWKCSKLERVYFGKDSQLSYIGGYAFHSCSSLAGITIPSKVTEIKELAFYNCKALEEIYFNAANMNDLPYAHNVRNLLSGTKAFENVKLISEADTTQKYEDFTVCYYDASALTSTKEYKDIITFNTISPKLKTKYTLSFFAKGVGKITTYLWNNDEGVVQIVSGESSQGKLVTPSDGSCTFDLNDEWNRYWVTYEFGASGTIAPKTTLFRIWGGNNTKASLCGVQLEERGTATDWTPSKEDYGATSVEALDNRVFYNAGTNGNGIKVVIGSNVTKIPAYLFRPHGTSDTSAIAEDRIVSGTPEIISVELEKRDIPLSIGRDAFYGHLSSILTAVHVPNIKTWCLVGFYDTTSNPLMIAQHLYCNGELVTDLVIPEGVTKINANAFRTCHDIVSVVIPDSVTDIGLSSFNYCTGIKEVVLGSGIKTIMYYAFNRRDSQENIVPFEKVYYKGSKEDWSKINFPKYGSSEYNDPLLKAPRYYYSEIGPEDAANNYWHYKDGFKISCNDDNMIDSKYFKVTQDGEVTATQGRIANWILDENMLYSDTINSFGLSENGTGMSSTSESEYPAFWAGYTGIGGNPWSGMDAKENWDDQTKFYVTNAGKMVAKNVEIKEEGWIGNLQINNNGLVAKDENGESKFSLSSDGLNISSIGAKIQVGDLGIYYDNTEKKAYLATEGPLYIQGKQENEVITAIQFLTETSGSDSRIYQIKCYIRRNSIDTSNKTCKIEVWGEALDSNDKPLSLYQKISFKFSYEIGRNLWGSILWDSGKGEFDVEIPAGNAGGVKQYFSFTYYGAFQDHFFRYKINDGDVKTSPTEKMEKFTAMLTEDVETITQTKSKNNIRIIGNIVPQNAQYNLGEAGLTNCWNNIYAKTTEIQLSDRNQKNSIEPLAHQYDILFDKLNPVRYKFNQNESDRYHIGFISQDVKEALIIANIPTSDFAGYIVYDKNDETKGCGLRYGEFIALNTDQIQKLKKRTAELENTIEELKSIIEELKTQQNDCSADNQEEVKGDEINGTETTSDNP